MEEEEEASRRRRRREEWEQVPGGGTTAGGSGTTAAATAENGPLFDLPVAPAVPQRYYRRPAVPPPELTSEAAKGLASGTTAGSGGTTAASETCRAEDPCHLTYPPLSHLDYI